MENDDVGQLSGLELMVRRLQDNLNPVAPPPKKVFTCLILHKGDIMDSPDELEEGFDEHLYELCMEKATEEGFYTC